MRTVWAALGFIIMSACGGAPDSAPASTETTEGPPALRLSDPVDFFDCVRESNGILIAAHRAGPGAGLPENALETMQANFAAGIRIFEVDVVTSRDGVMFLHHDRSLGRTTTGDGAVADTDWADISDLSLKDIDGAVTPFRPLRLTDALDWAVETGAILELDKKETTGWRSLIRAVETAGATNQVILITYTEDDAALVQNLLPDAMLTASARGGRDIAALEDLGIDRRRLIAWTGTRAPDAAAWDRVRNEGVEAGFGTLGRRGERLDDTYWADGNGEEYRQLVADGLTLLATDEARRVADFLTEDDRALNACAP
ncbi:MAG: glycerophosphodiester phosphodiesterase family protein [Pseudomonadota bacterium]